MAIAGHVGNLTLGNMLKIYSANGIYNNLSDQSDLWQYMEKKRVGKPEGREVRYALRTARGQTATQFVAPGSEGVFPGADRSTIVEATAYFKDFATTIDVPRHLLDKCGSELAAYGQPIADELDAKGVATARMLSRSLPGDGSGALGKIGTTPSVFTGGYIVVPLSTATADAGRSHVGWFEFGEKVQVVNPAGTTGETVTGGTIGYYKVYAIDEANDTVTLAAYTSADVRITVTATSATAGDYIYPFLDGTTGLNPDLSGSITDYGTLSSQWAGFESLFADDGRTVNGVVSEGAVGGSRLDAGGDTIDRTHFQSVLSLAKRRVGKGRYKWNNAFMFDDVYDSMMESWETDRMIVTSGDSNRGASKELGYQHGKDIVKFTPDEFIQKNRIVICPEGDSLQFRGTGIEQVELNPGQKFYMPNDSSGQHQRVVRSYLEGSGMLYTQHAAAAGVIENFIS